jgi:hypothetical protein
MDVHQSITGYLNNYAYEDITVDNTAGGKGFTLAKFKPTAAQLDRDEGSKARLIIATLEGAQARYLVIDPTIDGTHVVLAGGPGHLIDPGTILTFANFTTMLNFRIVRETAVNGTLRVSYFR